MAGGANPAVLDLPASDADAAARFEEWKSRDPFPEIRPALLNSADIADYTARTGMICPFYPARLKSASYPIRLLGDFVYWDDDGREVTRSLKEGDEFVLKKNSIAFVTLEPMFRFPDYIAGRFNLKIPNVYKGLLLGTGPLVDPGWVGHLSFPLHNLTTNDYSFHGGDELIWMEFTKLSDNDLWLDRTVVSPARVGQYAPFKGEQGGDVHTRVASSAPNTPVTSSLAGALKRADDAAKAAETAETTARTLARRYSGFGGAAVVVGLATLIALAVQVLTYKHDRPPLPPSADQAIARLEQKNAELRDRYAALVARQAKLAQTVRQLERSLARTQKQSKGG